MSEIKTNSAVLDAAHIGDINGAFGSISQFDTADRMGWKAKLKTLMAILGPGLIVMVGDNDAGAFSTYAQAGQNYGTSLLWTLLLLIPVLFVNQDMVLRLGAVTGVGHARLILERFGKFWGAFSAIDLFLLNALTIVTEFIGISLGMENLGLPKFIGVLIAAVFIIMAAGTGSFRRFERLSLMLVLGSLVLVPILVMVHPPVGQMAHDFFTVQLPKNGSLSDVMLLIIGIVGTTVAPWQLFFQQSYVIDKRITPRYISYERADLWIGIVLVVVGAAAMIAFTAQVFAGHPEVGHFADTAGIAQGLQQYYGRLPAVLFDIALIDASIIGAMAVSLSTAYALGDVLSLKHSLHRKPSDAKGFYLVYGGLILVSAALVLIPNVPLGVVTNAVQTLAGILLPSATVFLLMLCNDKAILGPWVNSRVTNLLTSLIVAVLVLLSVILTVAVVFPDISSEALKQLITDGGIVSLVITLLVNFLPVKRAQEPEIILEKEMKLQWRMPSLNELTPMALSVGNKIWMAVLRGYLVLAIGIVIYKAIMVATA